MTVTIDQLLQLVVNNGPFAMITVYLIWQGRKDYQGVCQRLNDVEDYCKTTLGEQLERSTKALEKNAEVIQKCQKDESTAENR